MMIWNHLQWPLGECDMGKIQGCWLHCAMWAFDKWLTHSTSTNSVFYRERTSERLNNVYWPDASRTPSSHQWLEKPLKPVYWHDVSGLTPLGCSPRVWTQWQRFCKAALSVLIPRIFCFFFLSSNYINKAALVKEGDEAALEPGGSRECNVWCPISSCTQVAF